MHIFLTLQSFFKLPLTPLREGRRGICLAPGVLFLISTHAPACGATKCQPVCMRNGSYFYSRPCVRGDVKYINVLTENVLFLLTPLREGRREAAEIGSDAGTISTHAPA